MILRKANTADKDIIWDILQYAIALRKLDGSNQWQDGYPNQASIQQDLDNGYGYVMEDEEGIILLYAAIIFDKEPAYDDIEGQWLSHSDYMVLHRIAVSPLAKGRGIAMLLFQMVEDLCRENNVYSIKVDTNFDNIPMLKILERSGYQYCGEVFFRGSARKAFEKLLTAS
ncbi:MAG: GNAT family N-acetyltransferase [Ferruginibacter sp.]